MKALLTILISLISLVIYSQNLEFKDSELKRYLLNENSVDLDSNGTNESILDLNSDQEIQLTEALAVSSLFIEPPDADEYKIQSFEDLAFFENLKKLTISCSADRFKNFGIDNLEELSINNCSMRYIDLSLFPNLKDIKLHSLGPVKYVNLNNGSVADLFSLFYSEVDSLICIDNEQKEYSQVFSWVRDSAKIKTECNLNSVGFIDQIGFSLHPNPSTGVYQQVKWRCFGLQY